ncbi:MAG: SIMPL domain-containing protein, partial [Phycisphaerae bacterium]
MEAEKGQWPRLITVNGDGEILVTPDEATIELGVETIDPDVEASLGKNSDAVRRVIQSITELGVDLPNIQTERLSINPVHRDQSRREDFLGYECRCTIFVRLTDLSKFETLVATALKNDARTVPRISLRTSELRERREQAMTLALKNAKAKAVKMAAELGQSIGKPLSITEEYSGVGSPYGRSGQSVFSGSSGGSELDSFAPGQILISAR